MSPLFAESTKKDGFIAGSVEPSQKVLIVKRACRDLDKNSFESNDEMRPSYSTYTLNIIPIRIIIISCAGFHLIRRLDNV
jgi:hypothetical protein